MSRGSRTPGLAEVLRETTQAFLEDTHIALPARVERYDAATQTVDVQPVVKHAFQDEEGARQVERLPVIVAVPVLFPRFGKFRITFPVNVGDGVLLVFSEQALDVWMSEGGEVDPLDDRRSHLTDAVALPGLYDLKRVLQPTDANAMTMGHDEGVQIYITETGINIGSNTGAQLEAAALGDSIDNYLGNAADPLSLRFWLQALATFVAFPTPYPPPVGLKSASVQVKK